MNGFEGKPAAYVGLQHRKGMPPYFLIETFIDGQRTTVQYRWPLYEVHVMDLLMISEDLFADPQSREIALGIIRYWGDTDKLKAHLRRNNLPIDEWQAWIYVLKQTGYLEGGSDAQGSIGTPRPDCRKMPT